MRDTDDEICTPGQPYFSENEVRALYQLNCIKTPGYLLIIKRAIQPEGNELHVEDVTKFCREWEISVSAFYRGVKTLKEKSGIEVIARSAKVSRNLEAEIRNRLYQELGGEIEVITLAGRVDLLTATELIEVKKIEEWKDALGQVLSYSPFFPSHAKRIHLFGLVNPLKLAIAQSTCSCLQVCVTFEEVLNG